jgi:hypothetical protein
MRVGSDMEREEHIHFSPSSMHMRRSKTKTPTCSSSAAADANATSHATVGTYPFVVKSPVMQQQLAMGATTTRVYPGSLSPKREKRQQTRELTVFNGLLK